VIPQLRQSGRTRTRGGRRETSHRPWRGRRRAAHPLLDGTGRAADRTVDLRVSGACATSRCPETARVARSVPAPDPEAANAASTGSKTAIRRRRVEVGLGW